MDYYTDPAFIDPTPDDPIDKTDILIYLNEQVIKLVSDNQTVNSAADSEKKQLIIDMNSKMDTLIQQGATGDSSLGSDNQQILTKLDVLVNNQNDLVTGANTVTAYGVALFPLIMITFLLWWFFRTFLKVY